LLPRPNQLEGENIERAGAGAGAAAGAPASAGGWACTGASAPSDAGASSTGVAGALFLLKKLNIEGCF